MFGKNTLILGSSVATAITAGTPFTIDLALDKDTLIATASVDVQGIPGASTTPPLDLSMLSTIPSDDPLYNFSITGGHQGTGFDLLLTKADLYRSYDAAAVPSMNGWAIALLCGGLVSAATWAQSCYSPRT